MIKELEPFTFGMGDRFSHQGEAQLQAVIAANKAGLKATPVWNKSNREHQIVGSEPLSLREEADAAVKSLGWSGSYYVDADHINMDTVDRFISCSDFFTLDVADYVGKPTEASAVEAFLKAIPNLGGKLNLPGLGAPLDLTQESASEAAGKFLFAIQNAGKLYRHIRSKKGETPFAVEVSIDETDLPQTPLALYYILLMIAAEDIPAQTIAPKFSGRFNKGVDYVGDLAQFEREFADDLAVLSYARRELGFPPTLKLSVHSGSDKFSIYPIINRLLKENHTGIHLKTAGTTWLEEVYGLAKSDGEGLAIAKEIYNQAFANREKLCQPYATVIDIDPAKLPLPEDVNGWDSEAFCAALEHNQECPDYNPHLRQLLHVGFKIAAQMGDRYLDALKANSEVIGQCVTYNLLERHLKPLLG